MSINAWIAIVTAHRQSGCGGTVAFWRQSHSDKPLSPPDLAIMLRMDAARWQISAVQARPAGRA